MTDRQIEIYILSIDPVDDLHSEITFETPDANEGRIKVTNEYLNDHPTEVGAFYGLTKLS